MHTQSDCKLVLVAVLFAIVTLICLLNGKRELWDNTADLSSHTQHRSPDLSAGNSTLGFGAIIAVSPNQTNATIWRQEGLIAAANRTGLHIQIPQQPVFTKKELVQLTHGRGRPGKGEAHAWLGHLHLLKSFLATDLTTVLILEDDADWDLSIRAQSTLLAPTIRNLTSTHPSASSPSPTHAPYSQNWDLLWLGHCGDNWAASPHKQQYPDPNTLNTTLLRGFYHKNLPSNARIAHQSTAPVCSFAYAVTRHGARKLLSWASPRESPRPRRMTADEEVLAAQLKAVGGGVSATAYDMALSQGCSSKGLDCLTVNPELFHHHRMGGAGYSQIGVVNGDSKVSEHDYTWNIGWSARCNAERKDGELRRCLPQGNDP